MTSRMSMCSFWKDDMRQLTSHISAPATSINSDQPLVKLQLVAEGIVKLTLTTAERNCRVGRGDHFEPNSWQ
jgi:hypothetical protein